MYLMFDEIAWWDEIKNRFLAARDGYSDRLIIIIIIIIIIIMTVPGKLSIDSLQKTAILETSHIIRKVLQCEA